MVSPDSMLALIPLLPFLGYVVNATIGRRLPKAISGGVACLVMLASFAVSVSAVMALTAGTATFTEQTVFDWMSSGTLRIPFTLYLDHLSSVMILVVTGIGSLIHIYSTGDMHDETDSEYARFFSYLNFFQKANVGYGSAIATVLALIIIVVTFLFLRVQERDA